MSGTVSVIVPIWNVERYLRHCVDSILAQTYTDLEVILVDDESPDGCGVICDGYASLDARVKVIHQKNRGLSGARNAGIDAASGSYLFFIDSDDWLDAHAIETLIGDLTSNNAGMAAGGMEKVFSDGSGVPFFTWEGLLCLSAEEAVGLLCRRDTFSVSAWGKLYKKSVFADIRYPEGKLAEDTAVIIDILAAAGTVTVRPDSLYKYRQRRSGIVHGKARHLSNAAHGMEAWRRNSALVRGLFPAQAEAAEAFYWYTCISTAVIASHGRKYRSDPAFTAARSAVKEKRGDISASPFVPKKEKFLADVLCASPFLFKMIFVITALRRRREPLYD